MFAESLDMYQGRYWEKGKSVMSFGASELYVMRVLQRTCTKGQEETRLTNQQVAVVPWDDSFPV